MLNENSPVETLMHMMAATMPMLPGIMRTLMSWASKIGPEAGTLARTGKHSQWLPTNLRTTDIQEESVCAENPTNVKLGIAMQLMLGHPGLQHTDCVEQTHRWTVVVSILRVSKPLSPVHTS